ncbi:MAG: hypothetical protein RL129_449 [Actinomycetota bacterium]
MKRKVVFVVAAVSALFLTSCAQVNTAAKVGKTEITNNQVQSTINSILKERSKFDTQNQNLPTKADLTLSAVRFHVISAIFDALAKGAELKISDGVTAKKRAEILAQLGSADNLPQALVKASIAQKDFDRYVRTIVIIEKMGQILAAAGDKSTDGSGLQKLVIAAAKREKVEINPRYGTWNYTTGTIDPVSSTAPVK